MRVLTLNTISHNCDLLSSEKTTHTFKLTVNRGFPIITLFKSPNHLKSTGNIYQTTHQIIFKLKNKYILPMHLKARAKPDTIFKKSFLNPLIQKYLMPIILQVLVGTMVSGDL